MALENEALYKRSKASVELYGLVHGIKRYLDGLAEKQGIFHMGKGVSGANLFIMMHLYDNKDKDIFQKDLEEKLNVRRSTVSKILGIMENKGMIRREQVEHDARLKKIVITDTAHKKIENWKVNSKKMESQLFKGFSEEELDQFYYLIHKAKQNVTD